jgi:hypothetical protein
MMATHREEAERILASRRHAHGDTAAVGILHAVLALLGDDDGLLREQDESMRDVPGMTVRTYTSADLHVARITGKSEMARRISNDLATWSSHGLPDADQLRKLRAILSIEGRIHDR